MRRFVVAVLVGLGLLAGGGLAVAGEPGDDRGGTRVTDVGTDGTRVTG